MVEAILPPAPQDENVRARELEVLKEQLGREHGGVAVISGPRGVGKDSLVNELIQFAETRAETVVLQGHTPSAGGRSFAPFAEIVRQAMNWAQQVGATESIIDPIISELEPVLSQHGSSEDKAALDQKLRFFDALRGLLIAISERATPLIVVHDLERADADTLELATYLADSLYVDPALDPTGPRGLLALLVRDDRHTAERARDFLAECHERPSVTKLALTGLDLAGLGQYLQSAHLLEKLMAASDGLPKEIDELFDALPSNVEELFERRLAGMDTLGRECLRALSLSGQPATARVVAHVTDRSLKDVAKALAELRTERVLDRRIENGEIQFRFARRSNLEVVQRSISKEDTARVHSGWVRALSEESGSDAALLAHHQLRSTEPTRGVPLAIKAAESHAVAGAFDAAAQLLEAALPHAESELELVVLERLVDLAKLRGKPREALRHVAAWKSALPSRGRVDALGKALRREAELFNQAGDYEQALLAVEEALTHTSDDTERAWVECAATEALYQQSALQPARERAQSALENLDAGETRTRIELLNLLGKIALAEDHTELALSIFTDTRTFAEECGLLREDARALVNVGLVCMRAGDHEEAERNLRLGIERATESNDLSHLAFGQLNLGVLAHQRGELGLAIESYRACRSLFLRLGNRTQLARVFYNLGNLYLLTGDVVRARAHNDEALRIASESGVEKLTAISTLLDGLILAEEDKREAGEARLREAMVMLRRLGRERPLEAMVELAAIQLDANDIASAHETIVEVEHALATTTKRRLSVRAKLIHGRTLAALGQPDAEALLRSAREEIASLGERLLLRDAELALGLFSGQQGQRETARMHLSAARELQAAVASELPAELRETFESARPQRAIAAASEALKNGSGSSLPAHASPRPAERRSSPPADDPRRDEWKARYGSIIGDSPKLFKMFHIVDRIAKSDDTVLIAGESGTGKELIAEAIHRNSPRQDGPFVKLNCAALVETLLLSELFGHERGSFTGAHQRKVGRFEAAAGGTIFLDEIGDISPKTQVSLLRVLQEREFERVGGGKSIKLQARVVCATNRNLQKMVREGTFREDLYYRLKGITIETPPLRERPEDIEELTLHFLSRYAKESGTPEKSLSARAVDMLSSYRWPGNVRELENVVRSVALFADATVIDSSDFDEYRELFEDAPSLEAAPTQAHAPPEPIRTGGPEAQREPVSRPTMPPPPMPAPPLRSVPAAPAEPPSVLSQIFDEGVPLAELKRRIQDEAIAAALQKSRGNITKAADMLGMKRPRLSQIINANETLKELCQGVSR